MKESAFEGFPAMFLSVGTLLRATVELKPPAFFPRCEVMSGPPPPPRNKNKLVPNNMKNQRHDEEYEQQMTPTGSGYNVCRISLTIR